MNNGNITIDSAKVGGNSIFKMLFGENIVYEVELDITTLIYDDMSLNVAAINQQTRGVFFSPDGTKMYVNGYDSQAVRQYTLGTPYDITTATYDNKSLIIGVSTYNALKPFFSPDGTKMYAITGAEIVIQFTLSTAWDLATATKDTAQFSVSGQDLYGGAIHFSPDGLNLYMPGAGTDTIYQYGLSTPWDIATASYASKSKNVAAQGGNISCITFNATGKQMFCLNDTTIYQYILTIPYDITTATYDNKSKLANIQETSPGYIFLSNTKNKMFIAGSGTNSIYRYSIQ